MTAKTALLAALAIAATGFAIYGFNRSHQAEIALAMARLESERWSLRARAAERQATQAEQDLGSLQGAIESARAASANATAKLAAAARDADRKTDPSNTAIMAYLGAPVSPPANLDARYAAGNLASVFTQLSKTAGLEVQKIFVDDSEFPFIVYGTIAGRHDLSGVKTALDATPGFGYRGAVSGSSREGSYFALNMIPSESRSEGAERRLMVRMQMLADKVRKP